MSFGELEARDRVPEQHFLRQLDRHLDWRPFAAALASLYHDTLGRPGYPPLVLFKALLLQRWYGLCDPGLEEAVRDRLSFQRFLGLALKDPVPDETTFCRFRHALARQGLGDRLFALLAAQLEAKGVVVRRGTLVDATLVQAQRQPPAFGKASPETEASWVKQGKKALFGSKAHVAVGHGSGLLRGLKLTTAKVPETCVLETLLAGDEAAVFADRACDAAARRGEWIIYTADILNVPEVN